MGLDYLDKIGPIKILVSLLSRVTSLSFLGNLKNFSRLVCFHFIQLKPSSSRNSEVEQNRKAMGDFIAKADEFEKKAEKKLGGWGFFGSKHEDAAELFDKAANSYKLAKSCESSRSSC